MAVNEIAEPVFRMFSETLHLTTVATRPKLFEESGITEERKLKVFIVGFLKRKSVIKKPEVRFDILENNGHPETINST